jgi:hypothetical protein
MIASYQSISLLPYVGVRDRDAEALLRLRRWHARQWMRAHGVRDLGFVQQLKPLNFGPSGDSADAGSSK